MSNGELLLELRAEEIPARMLEPGVRSLSSRLFEELISRGLAPSEVETGFTPRRLVVSMRGIKDKEPDREEEMLGPPVRVAFDEDGEPTRALLGFAERCGVEVGEIERRNTEKGEYVFALVRTAGVEARLLLAELIPRLALEINWPKSMRWGAGVGPWVRPLHGVVALFDGELIDFELLGIESSATTVGHSVLSPQAFEVSGTADYFDKVAAAGVEVRFEERRQALLTGMQERAAALGGELVPDEPLLDKLTSICGTPGLIEGAFAPEFLQLPREVLIASLRDHQSAFTVESDGDLLPVFLTVMDRIDDPAGRVQAGNEWVVAARLGDARFFWETDRKVPLAQRASELERLNFQAQLGSYADKAARLIRLGETLCDELGWDEERKHVVEAASLLKTDLPTEMVKEFTGLQGNIGGVYARDEGYPEAVWTAIYDQYLPESADDPIPRGRVGQLVALADRIDTVVGIFGIGRVPTGSKDPFGLRRAAQSAVRIVLEGGLEVDLGILVAKAVRFYGDRLSETAEATQAAVRAFLRDRVRHILGLRGYAYDEIEAALAVSGNSLPDLESRVSAIHEVRQEQAFLAVVLAAKRIENIVREAPESELSESLLVEDAEKVLYDSSRELRTAVDEAEAERDYVRCLRTIADFSGVLDKFFVDVLVMDENPDIRQNRIALLQSIQRVLLRTARLTEVVVDRSETAS